MYTKDAKYCSECGTELSNPYATTCPNCGNAIRAHYNEQKNEQKNALLAAFLSFLAAGAGQVYNGQIKKGIILLIFDGIFTAFALTGIGLVFHLIFALYAMVDAYGVANKLNRGEPVADF